MTLRGITAILPLPTLLASALFFLPATTAGAAPSPGCGKPPPQTAPDAVTVDGRERGMILAVPDGYDPTVPHDLVIAFHGRTNPAEQVRQYYELEEHARRPSLFVYPRGLPAGAGARGWWEPGEPASDLRDYALLETLVDQLSGLYCIDQNRVFAVGHSLGASFVNSLGCARGRMLRGIATVAGGMEVSPCQGETAALLVHHPEDRLVPFALGEAVRDRLLAANGLDWEAPAPLRAIEPPPGFCCERWGAWTDNPVVWCPHAVEETRSGRIYPHQWPVGTGQLVMAFFAALR